MNKKASITPSNMSSSYQIEDHKVSFDVSATVENHDWDIFLQHTPLGQFQQSSAWACYKKSEGWEIVRAIFRHDSNIIGGFQILWKKVKGMRVAYVSKGPVILDRFKGLSAYVIEILKRLSTKHKFAAIVVQPPDYCTSDLLRAIEAEGFISAEFLGIIDSTLLIRLDDDSTDTISRFRKSTRSKYNKAVRKEMKIFTGGEKDLPSFFELLKATCDRQGVPPNPRNIQTLRNMWSSLRPCKMIEVHFAEIAGELVSGQLLVRFGSRLTLYKTGWAGAQRSLSPPAYVICEILKRNSAGEYVEADFTGLDRSIAETVLAGKKITHEQNASRDAFKLGFGGQPMLLPTPSIWVPNFLLRKLITAAVKIPFIRSRLNRMV